jgi:aminomethyltransferase
VKCPALFHFLFLNCRRSALSRQTPLHATHVAAGAKLVDFAGWDMPIHYGSQLEEHKLVRADAGMFDVSHMLPVDIEGAGAQSFLRRLLANNIDKLKEPGRALYSCMLNEQGGVVDDLITYYFTPPQLPPFYRIVVNAGTADKDIAWMRQQAGAMPGGGNVTITARRDFAMVAVQGPQARAKVWAALPGSQAVSEPLKYFQAVQFNDITLCRTGYTGEDGFELIIPATRVVEIWNALAAAGVKPAGLGARDTLRLEAGMNLYGQDMDDNVGPLESGLAWTVDFTEGRDFIGRAALEAAPPARALVGIVLEDRGVLRSHMQVSTDEGGLGETTSGSFAPSMNASIAFARVPASVSIGDTVHVDIRGKQLKARVVKTPFVRHGKVLV